MTTILIANRGEIAIRIMRACRDMGIRTVAVYSDADRKAPHVRYADETYHIGPSPAAESYLRIDTLIAVARRAGADAIHPGYGFLAENEDFSRACRDAGIAFIGPTPEAIEKMGSKTAARASAIAAGVPVVPGTEDALPDTTPDDELVTIARTIGYPLLVKAVAGGGGKGMRVVNVEGELLNAVRVARSEAGAAFGDSAVFFERRIVHPRHIEIQLLGDHHGTVIPFVERECSVQRRHQKVIEESPSPVLTPDLRTRIAHDAAAVARTVGYTNAGTIEFLLDASGRYYFLEMNTRLQVEHPVTEMVTGLDLVEWQIRIARGEPLTIDPAEALRPRGHAIELRVYAEDPDNRFLPSPGRIHTLRPPSGPGIRRDSGVEEGFDVPIFYDSMISKLVAWGSTREQATARLRRALSEYDVRGIKTTIPFFVWMLEHDDFRHANFHTTYLDELLSARNGQPFAPPSQADEDLAAMAVAVRAFLMARGAAGTSAQASETSSATAPSAWRRAARRAALRS